jgi:hypothetical protein
MRKDKHYAFTLYWTQRIHKILKDNGRKCQKPRPSHPMLLIRRHVMRISKQWIQTSAPHTKAGNVFAICCLKAHTCGVPTAKRHKFLSDKFVTSDVDLGTLYSPNLNTVNQEHVAHIRKQELKTLVGKPYKKTTCKTYADKTDLRTAQVWTGFKWLSTCFNWISLTVLNLRVLL